MSLCDIKGLEHECDTIHMVGLLLRFKAVKKVARPYQEARETCSEVGLSIYDMGMCALLGNFFYFY